SPGLYEENHQLVLGLVGAQVHDIDGLRQLVVKTTPGGTAIRVGDVAQVVDGTLPVYTVVTANGKAAVLINITRQPSGNTVAIADEVATEVAQLKQKLPPGVRMEPYYDQSQIVRESISSVRDAILIGLLLACIVLFVFLHDWRSSLIAGLVIPVTVAVTVLFMWVIGESFNLMTLGGLAAAIGLVIDDAIVVVENIVLHRDGGESRVEAVRKAIHEISHPLIGSTITPVVVFLPLVAVSGVTGSFFRALAITMTVSLLTSLVLALTWTPSLALVLLRERDADATPEKAEAHAEPGPLLGKVMKWHESVLNLSLGWPLMLGLVCLVLVYVMPAGSSLSSTNRVLDYVERILRSMPEVESTSRRTGMQMGLAAVTEANTG